MATAAPKLQGALAAAYSDPSDPDTAKYNDQMASLMSSLIRSPEDTKNGQLKAWGAGLSGADGSGLAGALGRGLKSEVDYDLKDRELKAQYAPLIMGALQSQQQSRQLARFMNQTDAPGGDSTGVATVGGDPSAPGAQGAPVAQGAQGASTGPSPMRAFPGPDGSLKNVALPYVTRLHALGGPDRMEEWKLANLGHNMPAGSYQVMADGTTKYNAKLPDGSTIDPSGKVVNLPNVNEVNTANANAGEEGKQQAQAGYTWKDVPQADGTTKLMLTSTAIAQAGGNRSIPAAPGVAAAPVVGSGAQAPGPSAPPVAGGAGPDPTAPSGVQTAGQGSANFPPTSVNAAGHPAVSKAEQAARDRDIPSILLSEQASNAAEITAAQSAYAAMPTQQNKEALARAQADAAGIAREMVRNKVAIAGGTPAQAQTQIRQAAAAAPTAPVAATPAPQGDGVAGITSGIPTFTKQANEAGAELNKDWVAKSYRPTIDRGNLVQDALANVATARNSMNKMGENGTGWGGDTSASAAAILGRLGVKNADQYAGNAQMFQQAVKTQLDVELRQNVGPQTDQDAIRTEAKWANLKTTKAANTFALDLTEAKAMRDKQKADFFTRALPSAQAEGNVSQLDAIWQRRQPSIYSMPSMKKWDTK